MPANSRSDLIQRLKG